MHLVKLHSKGIFLTLCMWAHDTTAALALNHMSCPSTHHLANGLLPESVETFHSLDATESFLVALTSMTAMSGWLACAYPFMSRE